MTLTHRVSAGAAVPRPVAVAACVCRAAVILLLAGVLALPAGCAKDNIAGPIFAGFSSVTGLENTTQPSAGLYTSDLKVSTAFSFVVTFNAQTAGQTLTLTVDRLSGLTTAQAGFGTMPQADVMTATTVTDTVSGTSLANTGSITLTYKCTAPDGGVTIIRHRITIYVPPPVSLDFVMQPSSYTLPGNTMGTVTVQLLDSSMTLASTATNNVTISLGTNPNSSGTLTGTLTKAAVAGVATFSDLDLDLTALENGFTLVAAASGLTGDTSSAFNVTATGPVIFTMTPRIARAGVSVKVTGTNFNAAFASNTATFNGTGATITAGDTTNLTITVPTPVTAGDLIITDGVASDGFAYIVAPFRGNVTGAGAQVTGGASDNPSLSSTGQYVAYQSAATDIVTGDTNSRIDIFVRDNINGTVSRVSLSNAGAQVFDADCINPSISDDGNRIAFQSSSANLVTGDTNTFSDIFVRDRSAGTTTRVSVSTGGSEATAACTNPVISGNGRYVAFQSASTALVTGKSFTGEDVFLHDLNTSITVAVSVNESGSLITGDSTFPNISKDGRYVTFAATASLASNDSNGSTDIYRRDVTGGTTTLVSLSDADVFLTSGLEAQANNPRSDISDDGNRVLFLSSSADLAGPAGVVEVWMRNISAGTTTLISRVSSGGAGADATCTVPRISGDGLFASYLSNATNLVAGAGTADIYHYDIANQVTTRVNVDSSGTVANGDCFAPALSGDGHAIAFSTDGNNLVTSDTNGTRDVIVTSN
ncbi:MAG: TolB family protein [Planctomycetota bacterium]